MEILDWPPIYRAIGYFCICETLSNLLTSIILVLVTTNPFLSILFGVLLLFLGLLLLAVWKVMKENKFVGTVSAFTSILAILSSLVCFLFPKDYSNENPLNLFSLFVIISITAQISFSIAIILTTERLLYYGMKDRIINTTSSALMLVLINVAMAFQISICFAQYSQTDSFIPCIFIGFLVSVFLGATIGYFNELYTQRSYLLSMGPSTQADNVFG